MFLLSINMKYSREQTQNFIKMYNAYTSTQEPNSEQEKEIYKQLYKYDAAQVVKLIIYDRDETTKREDYWGKFVADSQRDIFRSFGLPLSTFSLRMDRNPRKKYKLRLDKVIPINSEPHLAVGDRGRYSKKSSASFIQGIAENGNQVFYPRLFRVHKAKKLGDEGESGGFIVFSDDPGDDPNFKVSLILGDHSGTSTYRRQQEFFHTIEANEYMKEQRVYPSVEEMFVREKSLAEERSLKPPLNESLVRFNPALHDPRYGLFVGFDNLKSKIIEQFRAMDLQVLANRRYMLIHVSDPDSSENKIKPYWLSNRKQDLQVAICSKDKNLQAMALMIDWVNTDYSFNLIEKITNLNIDQEFLYLLRGSKLNDITKIKLITKLLHIREDLFNMLEQHQKLILVDSFNSYVNEIFVPPLEIFINKAFESAYLEAKSKESDIADYVAPNAEQENFRRLQSEHTAARSQLVADAQKSREDIETEHTQTFSAIRTEFDKNLNKIKKEEVERLALKQQAEREAKLKAEKDRVEEERQIEAERQANLSKEQAVPSGDRQSKLESTPTTDIRMHKAVNKLGEEGNEAILKLLQEGYPVDAPHPNNGVTPLFLAVRFRDFEKAEILLKAGANPQKQDPTSKKSPLDMVIEKIQWEKDTLKLQKYQELKLKMEQAIQQKESHVSVPPQPLPAANSLMKESPYLHLDTISRVTNPPVIASPSPRSSSMGLKDSPMPVQPVPHSTSTLSKPKQLMVENPDLNTGTQLPVANPQVESPSSSGASSIGFTASSIGASNTSSPTSNSSDAWLDTELLEYIKTGQLEEFNNYLTAHPELDVKNFLDVDENSLLHLAVNSDKLNPGIVEKLLEMGLEPNAKNNAGLAPLHIIASRTSTYSTDINQSIEIITTLCNKRANVNIRKGEATDCGPTPLYIAVLETKQPRVVEALLKQGADVTLNYGAPSPQKSGMLARVKTLGISSNTGKTIDKLILHLKPKTAAVETIQGSLTTAKAKAEMLKKQQLKKQTKK